ncbi:MAG: hypothetical protein WDN08_20910 [Rhizomicrobium sp.]
MFGTITRAACLMARKDADQVDVQHLAPMLRRELEEGRLAEAGDAGIGVEDVELAVVLSPRGRRNRRRHLLGRIGGERQRRAAGVADRLGGILDLGGAVDADELGAFPPRTAWRWRGRCRWRRR